MDRSEQRRIVEALVLASPEPVSAGRLAEIVPGCKPGDTKDLVNELNTEYQEQDRSFEIWEVAGGYQVRTRAEFSGYLQQLQKQRPLRLSRAALDSLSIIAYKQPVTRAEIEDVRGVDAGAVLKGLLDRRLIRIAGQREVPGRPMLYATTRRFLEVFGLESLKGLPSLRELKELADEKGVALPGSEGSEGDDIETSAPAEPAADGAADEAKADVAGHVEAEHEDHAGTDSDGEAVQPAAADSETITETMSDELASTVEPEITIGGLDADLAMTPPVPDESMAGEVVAEESGPEELVAEESGAEEPVAEEHGTDEPTADDEDSWEPPEIVEPGTDR
jgi:segregation and condensation protein B